MKINLYSNTDSMVKAMPRIETLYYYVYELAQCFHADSATLQSIKQGIFENQIINRIYLKYKNTEGEKVAEIIIDIDWEKHFLLASTADGKYIQIDMNKSIVDNIVTWKKYVVKHLDEVMKQYDASHVDSSYDYRPQIIKDNLNDEAMKILGHVYGKPETEAINPALQAELSRAFVEATKGKDISGEYKKRIFDSGVMGEVTVSMTYKTNK